MHFYGLARKIDEAGELAVVESRSKEETEACRARAQHYLNMARDCLSTRDRKEARNYVLEGLKYDPENIELTALVQALY